MAPPQPARVPTPAPITLPPELNGCVWEERPIGGYRTIQCGGEVLPGKAWCSAHWLRFQNGKKLAGRGPLVARGSVNTSSPIG